ncbi:MAG: CotH kinase family protein [Verrucomicrobiota bacterium]|nr:CotH kinase family protein [Verrucomicrobiota bacterium]
MKILSGIKTPEKHHMPCCFNSLFAILCLICLAWDLQAQTVVINEFMASNASSTIDEDDNRSDWIEIHNTGFGAANLEGWSLTNDPSHLDKWTFPSVNLFPNGYLVVFASGKNRKNPGNPLHTDFRLRQKGAYLALLTPEGVPTTAFAPAFPAQETDVSFGRGVQRADEIVFLAERAPAKAMIPTNASMESTWTRPDFDDSGWKSGQTGIGYDYAGLIALDVRQMRGSNTSVYTRIPFQVDSLPNLDRLILRIRYDDGYVAYLNGKEIAADNEPNSLNWQSTSTQDRPDSEALNSVDIDISSALDLLKTGPNILAIQGLNRNINSSDILILPELIGRQASDADQIVGYMPAPSPGMPNNDSIQALAPEVTFSKESNVFTEPFTLTLSVPDATTDMAVEIRYTTDGSQPSPESTLYEGPMRVDRTLQLRAIAIIPGLARSRVRSQSYVELNSQVEDFNSNLPVLVIENYRSGKPPQNAKQGSFMMLFEPGETRTDFKHAPTIATRSGIKVRGSSTAGRSKPSLSLEAWNEFDQNKNIAPLGMPSESDWVLWGPYNFDLTLMHNPFIYELSNQIGRQASRTRFVEVFLNTNGGAVNSSDYYGVYAFMEKISRDEDRVNVERLFPEHDRPPGITGGYILKIDRSDPGDSGFGAASQSIKYVYPKEVEIERPERNAQESYIRKFFNDMGRALGRSSLADGEKGYAGFIDVDAAIDHHLLNVLAFNVDALRLSGYFHKPRNGKLVFGPIWDFDRALGSTDGRDSNPRVWRSSNGDRGTDFFNYPWWRDMFRDADFWQRYIDRYQILRRSTFSNQNIRAIIDRMASELREAQKRNLNRWNQSPRGKYGGTYQGEINHMKDWLDDRIQFMDGQFISPPNLRITGTGANAKVSLTSPENGIIYYTTDGSDPRAMGGDPSDKAIRYASPFSPETSTPILARIFDQGHQSRTGSNNPPLRNYWSGPVSKLISFNPPPKPGDLVITEIHYNPAPATVEEEGPGITFRNEDFEFIEIRNVGDKTVELAGVRFSAGIQFTLSETQSVPLAPGAYLVIAKHMMAFKARYPSITHSVMGPYQGNLSNGGENLILQGADGTPLLDFVFDDNWFDASDGEGASLVLRDEEAYPKNASTAETWRAGTLIHGSPGTLDPGIDSLRIDSIVVDHASIKLTFQAIPGISYTLEYATDVTSDEWQMLASVPAEEESGTISLTDENPDETTRFYRLSASLE